MKNRVGSKETHITGDKTEGAIERATFVSLTNGKDSYSHVYYWSYILGIASIAVVEVAKKDGLYTVCVHT